MPSQGDKRADRKYEGKRGFTTQESAAEAHEGEDLDVHQLSLLDEL